MTNWQDQYPLIREKAEAALKGQGRGTSVAAVAQLLGVSRGKVQAWARGQRPSADDLETLSALLGFSPEWLLTGRGTPETPAEERPPAGRRYSATNARGQLIGDLLWELFGLMKLDVPEAAKKTGIGLARLQAIMASEIKPEFDDLAKLHARLHLDVHFLLTGEGEAFSPYDEFTRIARATGTELWDDHGLARVFGCSVAELRAWKERRGTAGEAAFPPAWLDAALELYGVNPAWAVRGTGKSHLSRDEVLRQKGCGSDERHAVEDAAADPGQAAGSGSV